MVKLSANTRSASVINEVKRGIDIDREKDQDRVRKRERETEKMMKREMRIENNQAQPHQQQ